MGLGGVGACEKWRLGDVVRIGLVRYSGVGGGGAACGEMGVGRCGYDRGW